MPKPRNDSRYQYGPLILSLCLSMLVSESYGQASGETAVSRGVPNRLEQTDFIGTAPFDVDRIRRGLRSNLPVFSTLHPSVPFAKYQEAVAEALVDGFRVKGFWDVTVEIEESPQASHDSPETCVFRVAPGERRRWGTLRVFDHRGVEQPSIAESIKQIELPKDDDETEPAWPYPTYPSTGPEAEESTKQRLRDAFAELSIRNIDRITRKTVGLSVNTSIHLIEENQHSRNTLVLPAEFSSNEGAPRLESGSDVIHLGTEKDRLAEELATIYAKNFTDATVGWSIECVLDEPSDSLLKNTRIEFTP
ncbi:MAG: hypothetical protein AAF664_23105, partial [Planctomycetota bacterium]